MRNSYVIAVFTVFPWGRWITIDEGRAYICIYKILYIYHLLRHMVSYSLGSPTLLASPSCQYDSSEDEQSPCSGHTCDESDTDEEVLFQMSDHRLHRST